VTSVQACSALSDHALVYWALGLLLHVVGMFNVWLDGPCVGGSTMETLLIGWLTQSTMALLYDRLVESPRLVAVVCACLNVGLVLTTVG
jgi:hypothetical protein